MTAIHVRHPDKLFIDGRWVAPQGGGRIEVVLDGSVGHEVGGRRGPEAVARHVALQPLAERLRAQVALEHAEQHLFTVEAFGEARLTHADGVGDEIIFAAEPRVGR